MYMLFCIAETRLYAELVLGRIMLYSGALDCPAKGRSPMGKSHFVLVQMRPLREKIKELQSRHEAQVSSVLDKYKSLRKQVQEYNELLETALSASASPVDTSLASAVKAIRLR